jgi:uncharacterized membrane protein
VRRVEVLSDGVLAIAGTLLVLQLPFDKVGEGQLADALGHHWARFAAYGLSFVGIGILWLHHHAIFGMVSRADRPLVLLNLVLLAGAALLPFPTSLVGDYIPGGGENARVAALLYSANWVLVATIATAMCRRVIRTPGLMSADVDPAGARRLLRNFQAASVLYVAFTLVALGSAVACMACYAAATAWFISHSDYRALGRDTVEELD